MTADLFELLDQAATTSVEVGHTMERARIVAAADQVNAAGHLVRCIRCNTQPMRLVSLVFEHYVPVERHVRSVRPGAYHAAGDFQLVAREPHWTDR